MIKKILNWFRKGDEDENVHLPENENITFSLIVDNIKIGMLHCENGLWSFKYSDEFKTEGKEYNRIVGFPDLNKEYQSKTLWPFFRVRIPGLKQQAVQEIIHTEKIDQTNEAALLKRFGRKTMTNPYELIEG